MGGIAEVITGYICCTLIYLVSRKYVETYCKDNDPIIWIWLDDDRPQRGHPVRIITRRGCRQTAFRTHAAPSPAL